MENNDIKLSINNFEKLKESNEDKIRNICENAANISSIIILKELRK